MTIKELKDKATLSELALIEKVEAALAVSDAERKRQQAWTKFMETKIHSMARQDNRIAYEVSRWVKEFEENYKP